MNSGDASPFYDPDEGMVLAGVVDGVVVGYLVLVDVLFQLENEGKEERCFYLAYLGVDQSYRGSSLAGDLVRRAYEVRRQRRKRRKTYAAMIVNTYYNEELIDRVTGQRFKRLPGNSYLWYKRSG
ncbi:MAG: GNAT family N-acetyltransferase [Acidimicrobiales bacterium]